MNIFSKAAKGIGNAAKNTVKTIVKAEKDIGKASVKAVVDTAHVTGAVIKSDVGQALIGTALAVSGVGLPAAAAIAAGAKSGGTLIAKGGNLRKAGAAAVTGAELGAVAAVVGAGVRTAKDGTGMGGFTSKLLGKKSSNVPVTPPQQTIRPIDSPAVPVDLHPITSSGITPPSIKDRPADMVLSDVLGPVTGRKGTPSDTHAKSLRKELAPVAPTPTVIEQGSGGGGGGLPPAAVDAPKAGFNPIAAAAAVGVAILVGMFAVHSHGKRR